MKQVLFPLTMGVYCAAAITIFVQMYGDDPWWIVATGVIVGACGGAFAGKYVQLGLLKEEEMQELARAERPS